MSPIDRTLPHTLWAMYDDGDPVPTPRSAQFDNADDAEKTAKNMVDRPLPSLMWVRVFRTGNEVYEIFRWERGGNE